MLQLFFKPVLSCILPLSQHSATEGIVKVGKGQTPDSYGIPRTHLKLYQAVLNKFKAKKISDLNANPSLRLFFRQMFQNLPLGLNHDLTGWRALVFWVITLIMWWLLSCPAGCCVLGVTVGRKYVCVSGLGW